MRIVNSKNDRPLEELHIKSDVEFGVFFVYKKRQIAGFSFGKNESFPNIESARAACIDYLGKRADLGSLRVSFIPRKYIVNLKRLTEAGKVSKEDAVKSLSRFGRAK